MVQQPQPNNYIEPDVLLVHKPIGISSFDVLRRLRPVLGTKKLGHAGTLDPLARGLMIVGVNAGTKKMTNYLKLPKVYLADIVLGRSTTTGDAEGEITRQTMIGPGDLVLADVDQAVRSMVGTHTLPVPRYSAIKVDGKAASVGNDEVLQGRDVQWECSTTVASGLEITVQYTLEQGADALRASTIIRNPTPEAIEFAASDYIRADRTFEFGNDPATGLFWAHDDWFAQAYGVIVDGCSLKAGGSRGSVLAIERDGNDKVSLAAGESTTISRSIFPGGTCVRSRQRGRRRTRRGRRCCPDTKTAARRSQAPGGMIR